MARCGSRSTRNDEADRVVTSPGDAGPRARGSRATRSPAPPGDAVPPRVTPTVTATSPSALVLRLQEICGDDNVFYEDKFAMIWNIGGSIKGFAQQGCMAACHAGEAGKPFGNKYLANEGELGDIWHMKSIRTGYIGQVDDQYLDHTRYDKDKSPEAGRKSDPKTGGAYTDIKLVNGKPEFMHKNGVAANQKRGTYYLNEADKTAFDDSKFKPGDEVASILVSPFVGDRGDIATAIAWKSGKWTSVMSRKLVTGSKYDVQFDKLGDTYDFGLAAFDNAQVRHAYNMGALHLKFAK